MKERATLIDAECIPGIVMDPDIGSTRKSKATVGTFVFPLQGITGGLGSENERDEV